VPAWGILLHEKVEKFADSASSPLDGCGTELIFAAFKVLPYLRFKSTFYYSGGAHGYKDSSPT
jgi:hypothetical protein